MEPRSKPALSAAAQPWERPRLRRLGTVRDIAQKGDGIDQGNGQRGNLILS